MARLPTGESSILAGRMLKETASGARGDFNGDKWSGGEGDPVHTNDFTMEGIWREMPLGEQHHLCVPTNCMYLYAGGPTADILN